MNYHRERHPKSGQAGETSQSPQSRLSTDGYITKVEVSCLNRKEGIIICFVLIGTFVGGVFASPTGQLLNVLVINFPHTSHQGQSLNNHVLLTCGLAAQGPLFCSRAFPDGTLAAFVFPNGTTRIPAGSVLVVTDVNWSAISTMEPGRSYQFDIFLRPPSGERTVVFGSEAIVSADGIAAASEHMITGFVVSSTATMGAQTHVQFGNVGVFLQGYLMTLA